VILHPVLYIALALGAVAVTGGLDWRDVTFRCAAMAIKCAHRAALKQRSFGGVTSLPHTGPVDGTATAERQLILIVEDEKDLADLEQFNLRQAGFDTVAVRDGEQALEMVRQRLPDLILLDLLLPGVPRTEVCRQLKSSPRTKQVPVIMVTARGQEVDRVVGFELGADDFVPKPFSMRELVLRVRLLRDV